MKKMLSFIVICLAMIFALSATASSSPTLTLTPSAPKVGDVVTGLACGLQHHQWYNITTYGPNTTRQGPVDSIIVGRADDNGCLGGTLLNPAKAAGEYSTYVVLTHRQGTGGSGSRIVIDLDYQVSS